MTPFPTLRARASTGFSRYGAIVILGVSVLAIAGWLRFYGPVTAESLGGTPRGATATETRK